MDNYQAFASMPLINSHSYLDFLESLMVDRHGPTLPIEVCRSLMWMHHCIFINLITILIELVLLISFRTFLMQLINII